MFLDLMGFLTSPPLRGRQFGMTDIVLEKGGRGKGRASPAIFPFPTNNALCHSECNEESQHYTLSISIKFSDFKVRNPSNYEFHIEPCTFLVH
jgi:hypothetical protein